MHGSLGTVYCTTVFCACIGLAFGQEQDVRVSITPRVSPEASKRASANLRLDVKVVLVPVTVSDALDRPLTSLSKDSFRLLEDGVEQQILSFAREDGPVSLGILFDTSRSMKNRMDASILALKYVLGTTIPGDELFLVEFADRARLANRFTSYPDDIYARMGELEAKGWTALFDAVALGVNQMKSAKNRSRALLILSDGNDNNSRFTASEIKSLVMESDLRVYAVCLNYRPQVLQQLADETGGKVLIAKKLDELEDAVQRLSVEIRSQYVLGYSSSNPQNDGKYRRVKVEVAQPKGAPNLHAAWRRGYYAPE